ncbi:MAG: siderophore-interacting protein [Pseudomonadota bacterium]
MNNVTHREKKRTDSRAPRLLIVKQVRYLTPNMIRVTFAGASLKGISLECAGANCKIMIPEQDQDRDEFISQMHDGPRPITRTYTVRSIKADPLELDIDFVAHGENGPASKWAMNAKPGDFCGFAGPGPAKVTDFYADWYLVAADMAALPVALATLEAMPENASGVAIFEVLSEEDKQEITVPNGIKVHWMVSPDPYTPSVKQIEFVEKMEWPQGIVQTCIAGESSVVRTLRDHVNNQRSIERKHTYISGYWKIGLIEDEHQAYKREANTIER